MWLGVVLVIVPIMAREVKGQCQYALRGESGLAGQNFGHKFSCDRSTKCSISAQCLQTESLFCLQLRCTPFESAAVEEYPRWSALTGVESFSLLSFLGCALRCLFCCFCFDYLTEFGLSIALPCPFGNSYILFCHGDQLLLPPPPAAALCPGLSHFSSICRGQSLCSLGSAANSSYWQCCIRLQFISIICIVITCCCKTS